MVMSSMSDVDVATLHNDCNISHTISQSSVTLSPNALENLLEKSCLCTLKEIVFHLKLENIDIRHYSKESQFQFLTRLASERFQSTCFTDSNNTICIKCSLSPDLEVYISNWNVEQLKEYASKFTHEESQIPVDVKLHLACLTKDHRCVKDLLKEAHTTDPKKKNMFIFYGISCEEIVDALVKSGVDVNTKDARGRTPLFYALTSSLDSAKKLLDKGASVTKTDDCQVSVLTFFADNMLKSNFPAEVKGERIKLLSQKGISRDKIVKEVINLILCKFIQVLGTIEPASNTQDNYLNSSMLCELLELVLSHTNDGTRADDRNSLISQLQSIPGRIAADNFVNLVSDVLQSFDTLGANPSAPDSEGNTCLHYATQLLFYGVPEKTVTELCNKLLHMKRDARLDAKNHKKETPLLFCLSSRHLIASKKARNWSGCLWKVCEVLMNKGSKLRHTNHKEESAFHLILKICQFAILIEDEHLRLCIFEEMFEILSKFSENEQKKAAVRKRDIHLDSPLHLLASLALKPSDHYHENVCDGYSFQNLLQKILDLLLRCEVVVDDSNENKQTPLHMCRTWTAAKLLLDAGAESDVKDSSGCTPLLAAAKRNTCIKKDSKRFYPDVTQTPNAFWKEVLDKKLNPWTADKNGDSVLSILIQKEANCLAKALIETACDQGGQIDTIGIPLLIAVCKDQSTDKHWKLDLVKLLVDSRRSLVRSTLGSNNDTALHFSCRNILELPDSTVQTSVHWKIAQYLLLCGADINAAGETGKSCLALSDNCPVLKGLLSTPVDHSTLPLVLGNWKQSSESHAQKLSLVARMVKCQQVKSLFLYPEPLEKGKGFAGIDQRGREVAVKRIDKSQILPKKDPESVLVLSVRCEQIVEYIFRVEQEHFHYLAFELMEGDLEHYLDKATGKEDATKLCKDLLLGLQFLQSQDTPVVHGSINPRTVFYQSKPNLCLKVGNCKTSSSRRNWVAPEVLKGETSISKESDVFSCGLVLHYLLSSRNHPFAPDDSATKTTEEVLSETDNNIRNGNIVRIDDSLSPEAAHLVHLMLGSDPNNRPSGSDALAHPFFWDKKTKKEFLIVVGNEPEFERGNRHPLTEFENELEGQFSGIVSSAKWNDPSTYGQISATCAGIPPKKRQNYNFGSVADLIRFIRNVYGHITDHESRIRDWWNKYCIFDDFPQLIIEVYKKVKGYNLHNSRPQVQKFFNEL